jgi:predicted alpha-1,2-mannosidase
MIITTQVTLSAQYCQYVNPFIGTDGMGHTFPGACVPFGSVQLSPDTDTIPHNVNGIYQKEAYRYCAGYQYGDQTIVGFSHTHLNGTGHADLGDLLIMPVSGVIKLHPGTKENPESGYRSRFDHNMEKASPGYYEVFLKDYNVLAQLTTTERTGIHKYTFQDTTSKNLVVDLSHGIYNYDTKTLWSSVRIENDSIITGYRITNGWSRTNYIYFAIHFSEPIQDYGYEDFAKNNYNGFWRKFDIHHHFPEIAGKKIVLWFTFGTENKPLIVKIGISAVSAQNALENLKEEAMFHTFDDLAKQAHDRWEEALSVIDIQGNANQKAMFYTSLYHTMMNPSLYTDVNKQYRGIDNNIHEAQHFTNYTVFSLWDTFRAFHPLLNIINRKRNTDMVNSMLAHYQQSVHHILPVWSLMANENWCMTSYHGVSVVADAITKELDINKKLAVNALVQSSSLPYYEDNKDYIDLGYVPFDKNAYAASITLENSYEDWAVYYTALHTGDTAISNIYRTRALNYRNIYNHNGFACPRFSDGTWKKKFNPLNTHNEGFIEGNSWNYSFFVPHDVNGLIKLTGGDKKFIARLDSLFTMKLDDKYFEETEDITRDGLLGNYVHGNEPGHHIAYLYMWTSQPWKTQDRIREIMNKMYKNSLNGLSGNDDCGQMSAWYILSAMGFYPVCPGTNEYVIGAPYLPYLAIKLENGNTFTIKAPKISDQARFIQKITLNGQSFEKAYITINEILDGGELLFEMGSQPLKTKKFSGKNLPYSLSEP